MKSLKIRQFIKDAFLSMLLILVCSGCSTIGGFNFVKTSVSNAAVSTIEDMLALGFSHDDVPIVKSLLEADLILVETLSRNSPDNMKLLAITSKLYGYYSFGFIVVDEYEDIDPKDRKDRRLRSRKLYWRGINYGMQALKTNKKFKKALEKNVPFKEALKYLSEKDLPAAYATALNMGFILISNLDIQKVLALASDYKDLTKWLIETDDTFEYGTAHVLLGVYYAIMPAAGGGGPEKARAEFEKSIMIEPDFFLTRFFYARYYPTLVLEEEVFDQELQYIFNTPPGKLNSARALNEIAIIKAKSIQSNREFYF